MFKENKEFWLYIFGTIILFLVIIYGLRSYVGPSTLSSLFTFNSVSSVAVTPVAINDSPPSQLDKGVDYSAIIKTNKGEVKIDLFEKNAPNTVNNFIYLAGQDYYDGTKFHRLIPDVLLQGGSRNTLNDDPGDDQFGGPGYIFADEINWDSLDFEKALREELTIDGYVSGKGFKSKDIAQYTLAMANAGPNTNGSQFFFVLSGQDNASVASLRGRHTIFARVTENTELIDSLGTITVDNPISLNPRPIENIIIEDVEILH